ncbi:MAG: primosomal protein N' [Halothiobacillaceae bacterium]
MPQQHLVRVAVPAPVAGYFDYLHEEPLPAGVRVSVPFGRGERVGVVVSGQPDGAGIEADRLRPIAAVLDEQPLLCAPVLRLLSWAAGYYHAPPGEVFAQALPVALRRGDALPDLRARHWTLTDSGRVLALDDLRRAPRQQALLARLHQADLSHERLSSADRQALRVLEGRGWVASAWRMPEAADSSATSSAPDLNEAQQAAVQGISAALAGFGVHLLEGVTGSGKTEVYLALIRAVLASDRQVLVLVPEIALTPQLLERFEARLGPVVGCLHSGLADGARLRTWESVRQGQLRVLIGTRSAVLVPLPDLGLIVVDEEHDGSLKQQEGFRYHGRDMAIWRAKDADVPVVLGSATPSLETLWNVDRGRFWHWRLPQRAGNAKMPRVELLDMRRQRVRGGLSDQLIDRMRQHLLAGGQVLLFLNRRGYAPTLLCHACGWVAECRHCDAGLTLHRRAGELRCHHCGAFTRLPPACPACGAPLSSAGQGTEQLEETLVGLFPEFGIERVDRDTVAHRGSLEKRLARIRRGEVQIVVGTQMLAKGHDFPGMSLVGIVDADQGLFSGDFRASERLAQLVTQVAGRAGRAERAGEVLIQTHQPDHPLLLTLIHEGYPACARQLLAERASASLPPQAPAAVIRADSPEAKEAEDLLRGAADLLADCAGVTPLGPVPAPMARRAGRHRYQMFVQATGRGPLHEALDRLQAGLPGPRRGRLRWSIDVDPVDMY